jgi:anti-anti-sigma regulatory factor
MDFYFKPQPDALKDNILRVAPDILPPGSVRIQEVLINGSRWTDFDAEALTVRLPSTPAAHPLENRPGWAGNPQLAPSASRELKVRVRMVPASQGFDAYIDLVNGSAELSLSGNLSDVMEPVFRAQLDRLVMAKPKRVVLRMENLQTMSNGAARALGFASGKLDLSEDIYVVGANEAVTRALKDTGIWEEFRVLAVYDAAVLAQPKS